MILYKAIKYQILDMCLESLFRTLRKNVLMPSTKITFDNVSAGMKFRSIVSVSDGWAYDNCTILEVYDKFIGVSVGNGAEFKEHRHVKIRFRPNDRSFQGVLTTIVDIEEWIFIE
jgi:hypothetical protein